MKKISLTFSLLVAAVFTYAQSAPFVLKGKIIGHTTGRLKLSYEAADGKFVQDSTLITNGTFQFKGSLAEPSMAYIESGKAGQRMDDPNRGTFFIEPGELSIEITANNFKNLKLKGSKTQDEVMELDLKKKKYTDQRSVLSVAYDKANTLYMNALKAKKTEVELERLKEAANHAKDKMDPLYEEISRIDMEFMKTHPDSYYTAYALRWRVSSLPLAEGKELYGKLSDRIKQSSYGKGIAAELKSLEGGSPGSKASVFSVQDINGEMLNLADFKDQKYVLLDFWASWCVPCRKGNPHLLSLYSKYKDKGLEIVGVSDDDSNHEAWKKAVEKDKIGVWRHVLRGLKETATGFDKSADITEPYAIHSLPTKILIDKNGMIIGRYGGGGDSDEAMDKKLAEIFN